MYQGSSARGKCTCRELLFIPHTQPLPYPRTFHRHPCFQCIYSQPAAEAPGHLGSPFSQLLPVVKGKKSTTRLASNVCILNMTKCTLHKPSWTVPQTPELPLSHTLLTEASEQQTRCSRQTLGTPRIPVHSTTACPISFGNDHSGLFSLTSDATHWEGPPSLFSHLLHALCNILKKKGKCKYIVQQSWVVCCPRNIRLEAAVLEGTVCACNIALSFSND